MNYQWYFFKFNILQASCGYDRLVTSLETDDFVADLKNKQEN